MPQVSGPDSYEPCLGAPASGQKGPLRYQEDAADQPGLRRSTEARGLLGIASAIGNTFAPQLLSRVARLIGGPCVSLQARPRGARHTLADNNEARRVLGWRPEVNFEDGFAELILRDSRS